MKIRIGKSFDKETNEVFYQLQFKLDGERTYNAYSYDVFKEESDAKEALNKHLNGEREYTYFVSAEKVKRVANMIFIIIVGYKFNNNVYNRI